MFKVLSSTTDTVLAYQLRFLYGENFAAQGDFVPQLMNEALPTPDLKEPQRSVVNARSMVNSAGEIEGGAHLYHDPPVVDLTGDRHSFSSPGISHESLVNASSPTQQRVEHTPKTKSRIDNQVAESRSRGTGNAKLSQKGEVRNSLTGSGIEYMDPRTGVWCESSQYLSRSAIVTK